MDDKKSAAVLTEMLKKYPLTADEQEALRVAIGLLGWTKLVEGWKERRKKFRDDKLESDAKRDEKELGL
jgi:hypothetical protein